MAELSSLLNASVFHDLLSRNLLETRFFYQTHWLKIFHHVAKQGTFTNSNVMHNYVEGLFSILESVDESFRYEGKYEMLIECSSPDRGFIWWSQDHLPIQSEESDVQGTPVDGFYLNPLSKWSTTDNAVPFTGLAKSTSQEFTLFDGTGGPSWYFAIGMKKTDRANLVPCRTYANEIILWIRIPYTRFQTVNEKVSILIMLLFSFVLV